MWRALSLLVVLLLGAGVYALVTGGATAGPSPGDATGPTSTQFGYALAAGAVALGATLLVSRPRMRFRR